MDVHPWVWAITVVAVLAFFVFDFYSHVRTPHEPTIRESATWSIVYVVLAVAFGIGIGVVSGWTHGGEFLAGYFTEKALSVDNLFVFLLIMTSFQVPRKYQQKVLLFGVAIALVMRGIFIAVGAAILENFTWAFYLFALVLFWLAIQQVKDAASHSEPQAGEDNLATRFAKRFLRTTDDFDGDRLTTRVNGKKMLTPLALVIVVIGLTDVMFAFDSIPAIFGLTHDAFIVFTANAFALMGLRQLYFLIGGLLERLIYLAHGLAVILAFIGIKMVFHAMHENQVPFINGGQPIEWAPEIPIWLSLVVIFGTLLVAALASFVVTKHRASEAQSPAVATPTGASAVSTAQPKQKEHPEP